MLVYANHLGFQGAGADEAILKAIGGWFKEQLGFGIHPDQLTEEGDFEGARNGARSWLRVHASNEEEPSQYAWLLKNVDAHVRGRQWITELGLKISRGFTELSCVLKSDAQSTLVVDPVMASQPRLIRYAVNNIQQVDDAELSPSTPGLSIKTVGEDVDAYRALLVDIERHDRNYPIVLVSATKNGAYLLDPNRLQQALIGLAQVVQVSPDFNSYEMEEVLGQPWSAWSGAVNILHIPTQTGFVRSRLSRSEAIEGWGDTQQARVSQLLALVTHNTNVPRLRKCIRPERVMHLALRRRLQTTRARRDHMDALELQQALEKASRLAEDEAEWAELLEQENSRLEADVADLQAELDDAKADVFKKQSAIQALKKQLTNANGGQTSHMDIESLLNLACRTDQPTPLECIELIESIHGDKCMVLDTARASARAMNRFSHGRRLLDMLKRLVTEYRSKLMKGGDNMARFVFGKNEYAAKESDTTMLTDPLIFFRSTHKEI